MKRKRQVIVLIVLLCALAAVVVTGYRQSRSGLVDGYEDRGGLVYECSKPIKVVADGGYSMLGYPTHKLANVRDVQYCTYTGIE